ncbi:unnamed protein product [Darwinula stevensoni]|uniref:Acetyl-CoA hydrolase n=1 Tax=Darwinula stevensoni TaxID=69355 RepID=A0A7R9A8Z9_9CRUS|nr:unnamed protein product [Darwinula stevensoni]CAG0896936.1 unnamed protein product [Darwinula stevensoni]
MVQFRSPIMSWKGMKQLAFTLSKSTRMMSRLTLDNVTREPFHPMKRDPVWKSAEEAVKVLKSGDTVFIQGSAATPMVLIDAMCNYAKSAGLKDIRVCHMHTEGPGLYNEPEYEGIFRSNSFFVGSNCRKAVNTGRGDFIPIFLSEIPMLFHSGHIKPNVVLVQVCPADDHGFCSLGTSVDCTRAAIQHADYIIGQVNPKMPRSFGDGIIHESHFDAMVSVDVPLSEVETKPMSPEEAEIGKLIAENLVEDGATIQMGIGNIPNAVLSLLHNHKDLGVHTEMFSDGLVPLVECGAVSNHRKKVQIGKIVSCFVSGSRVVFDFLDDNPLVAMMSVSFTNNRSLIAMNPKVTSINSCIEVDLTGQVVSDSIGSRIYSGVGGQIDFLRGAAVCSDGRGKPIIALQSATKRGESKIVPYLKKGAGVVTTRAHVHYIVTEHGIVNLFGKNLRQRAHALISIAHPDHRESLEKDAFERLKCMPSPD